MAGRIINSQAKEADFVILGANYDRTSSYGKGSDTAPKTITEILEEQIEDYERWTGTHPSESMMTGYHDLGDLGSLSPEDMVSLVAEAHQSFDSRFVLTLGGEHSVTNGPLLSLSKRLDPHSVTVVQIDAHFDLRPDDSDYNPEPWGPYAHCSVMRRAYDLGFPTVHVGVRAYHDALERRFAVDNNLPFFEWGLGHDHRIEDILAAVSTPEVYLTVDVDGFDPSCMPGTGTPVEGGLGWVYGKQLIRQVFQDKKVIGADIVEVAPGIEGHRTPYNAAELVYFMIALQRSQ